MKRLHGWMRGVAVLGGLALGWQAAPAAEATAYRGHGLAMHGDLKYPPGFTHFDYVQPDAPKGGAVRLGASGGYDSLNSFILRGNAADGLELLYDTLLTDSADEPFSAYGRLAETMEVPADRSWVIFDLRPAHGIDGLPDDDHGHDRGFPGARGQLERQPHQFGIRLQVGGRQMIQKILPLFTQLRGHFGQPNGCFNRLNLTEKGANTTEGVMPPVLEQAGRFRSDLPVRDIRKGAPGIDMAAQIVDDRDGVVPLFLGRKAESFIENQILLRTFAFLLLRFGNGGDKFGPAARFDNLLGRLTA